MGIGTLIPAGRWADNGLAGLPAGVGLTLVGTIERIAILLSHTLPGSRARPMSPGRPGTLTAAA